MLPTRNAPTDAFTIGLPGRRVMRVCLTVLPLGTPRFLLPALFRLPAFDRDVIEAEHLSHRRAIAKNWTGLLASHQDYQERTAASARSPMTVGGRSVAAIGPG
jgi:hypothetical protein